MFQQLGAALQKIHDVWIEPRGRGKRYRVSEIKLIEGGELIDVVIEYDGGTTLPIECARWRGALKLLRDGQPHEVRPNHNWAKPGSVERAAQDEAGNCRATATWIAGLLIQIGWMEIINERPLTVRLRQDAI